MTAPSNSKCTPCCSAREVSSAPRRATGPLFVVQTLFPDSSAHRTCETAGSPSSGLVNVASQMMSAVQLRITDSLLVSADPP